MRKHKTLDMIFPDSEIWCLCCHEPLLAINDDYLACRWTSETSINDYPPKVVQVGGKRALPCRVCDTMRIKEARYIVCGITHYRIWCPCGYENKGHRKSLATDFLATDYLIEWLEPPLRKQAMIDNFQQMKMAVLEALQESNL